MASTATGSAGKILNNSFWYGIETVLETVIFLGTGIVVARAFGPEKLGHFNYVNLFVSILTSTGGSGLAGATRKYMSEFLALDRPGIARAVYHFTWRYQLLGSVVITALGIAAVWLFGDPHFRVMSCILIASIIPGVMSWVPAQANNAYQDLAQNTFSAFGYLGSYVVIIVLTLHFHWDLVGIAAASLVGRTAEVVLRTIPLHRKLAGIPLEPLPKEMAARVRQFCFQAMGVQLIMAVVYNRTEVLFLGHYSTWTQVGIYSASAGLASKLLLVPRTLGGATGVTLMVESTRDPSRVDPIMKNASRFLLLVAIPVHLGAAAIAIQAVPFVYGAKYMGAIPVLITAAILSIPLAFQELPDILLRAADRQKKIMMWLIVTGVLNMLLDWILIPRFAAVGAAWGNGLSQAFGLCALWIEAQSEFKFSLPKLAALRILLAGSIMAATAFAIVKLVPPGLIVGSGKLQGLVGLVLAVVVAAPLYVLLVKLFHGLEPSDRLRLRPIGNRLPGPFRRAYFATIAFVTPTA